MIVPVRLPYKYQGRSSTSLRPRAPIYCSYLAQVPLYPAPRERRAGAMEAGARERRDKLWQHLAASGRRLARFKFYAEVWTYEEGEWREVKREWRHENRRAKKAARAAADGDDEDRARSIATAALNLLNVPEPEDPFAEEDQLDDLEVLGELFLDRRLECWLLSVEVEAKRMEEWAWTDAVCRGRPTVRQDPRRPRSSSPTLLRRWGSRAWERFVNLHSDS